MANKIKEQGKVYTPNYIVKNILNLSGYKGNNILQKHVIDNSCGDGAFLKEIVKRYCDNFLKTNNDLDLLKKHLEKYIHGIEIEDEELKNCKKSLKVIVNKYGVKDVNFDLNCADALLVNKYNNLMDFVIGNPPYIRVHNFKEKYTDFKSFVFSQEGMTDAYLVFYELGIKMLSKKGILAYITPNSLYNSLAANIFRKYLVNNKKISKVVDLKHFQCFNATTYTTILVLDNNINKKVEYYEFDENNLSSKKISVLNYNDFYINNKFYFGTPKYLKEIRKILTFKESKKYFEVKNGFATLNDKVFIGKFNFKKFTIPVIKASTGKYFKCIFPYKKDGTPIHYDEIKKDKKVYEYFEKNKHVLKKRDIEENYAWWLFGRTQAIKDVYKNKIVINSLIRNINDIKVYPLKEGVGVYSGLYILTSIDFKTVQQILLSEDFINYIRALSKYKSGGYYTFSSKDLQLYLNYKYSNIIGDIENELFDNY